ncbi:MAG: sensor histidine kinase [Vicinamibacterales bacterium]
MRHSSKDISVRLNETMESPVCLPESSETAITERERAEQARLSLLDRLAAAEEDERRRIARELHDHFGQMLTLLRLQTDRIKAVCREPALRDQVEALEATATHLDQDIHHFLWELRPEFAGPAGLLASLAHHLHRWSAKVGIPVELRAGEEADTGVPPRICATLHQITKEALTNVAKHARAAHVIVTLERVSEELSLVIEDDGVGFQPDETAVVGRGLGLLGIHERAALVAARVQIRSAPRGGTAVVVRVAVPAPIPARP